jgi:hypothetical protein
MMFSRDGRDKRGLSPKSKPVRGSYAEQRINELRKERAKYNVNDLGFYNGGVPRAHRGNIRGMALDSPNGWHSPQSIISWISIMLIPTECQLKTLLSSSISWELTRMIFRELCQDSQCTTTQISTTQKIEISG